jgi:hypothetical protein
VEDLIAVGSKHAQSELWDVVGVECWKALFAKAAFEEDKVAKDFMDGVDSAEQVLMEGKLHFGRVQWYQMLWVDVGTRWQTGPQRFRSRMEVPPTIRARTIADVTCSWQADIATGQAQKTIGHRRRT